jgi:hypothetical protein
MHPLKPKSARRAPLADGIVACVVADDRVASTIAAFEEIGVDEVYLVPAIAELDQIDRPTSAELSWARR